MKAFVFLIILAIIAIPCISIGSEISFCKSYSDVWQAVNETLKKRNELIEIEDKETGAIRTESVSIQPDKLYEYAVIEGVYRDIEWEKAEYQLEIKISKDAPIVVKVSAYIRGYGGLKGEVKTFKPTAFWSLKSNGRLEKDFLNNLKEVIDGLD